ncbi:MAG: PIG-L deacetylase family protein, partial [Promethearchaeota archaeon]
MTSLKEKNWKFVPERVRGRRVPLVVPESMMVFAAHPDDELLSAGGTILKYSAMGCRVKVVVATSGVGGYARREYKDTIVEKRRDELERVSAMLKCEFLELDHESLEVDRSMVSEMTNLIRDERPQVIL